MSEVPPPGGCGRVRMRCSKAERGQRRMRNRSVGALVILCRSPRSLSGVDRSRRRAHRDTATDPRRVRSRSASFDFAESRLLAEIYAQALERAGVPVRRAFGLGPRELVASGAREGLVDVVPEYAGHRGAVPEPRPRAARGRRRRRRTPRSCDALRGHGRPRPSRPRPRRTPTPSSCAARSPTVSASSA